MHFQEKLLQFSCGCKCFHSGQVWYIVCLISSSKQKFRPAGSEVFVDKTKTLAQMIGCIIYPVFPLFPAYFFPRGCEIWIINCQLIY